VIAEYQAKRFAVDIVDGSSSPTMLRERLDAALFSPIWPSIRLSSKTSGFGASPIFFFSPSVANDTHGQGQRSSKTYDELPNPRWKDR
jgi:hypothetical protein